MTDDLRAALPTICKCGSAKDYHRPSDDRDHEYEPRYDPESWREGYRAALAVTPDADREGETLADAMSRHDRADSGWTDD